MAKTRRVKVGSVLKNKDGSMYVKFYVPEGSTPHTFKNGETVSLESKKKQLDSLQSALEEGKLSEENAAKARERIESIPDFVVSEMVRYEKLS